MGHTALRSARRCIRRARVVAGCGPRSSRRDSWLKRNRSPWAATSSRLRRHRLGIDRVFAVRAARSARRRAGQQRAGLMLDMRFRQMGYAISQAAARNLDTPPAQQVVDSMVDRWGASSTLVRWRKKARSANTTPRPRAVIGFHAVAGPRSGRARRRTWCRQASSPTIP